MFVRKFKELLGKNPYITYVIVGAIVLMLVLSSVGLTFLAPMEDKKPVKTNQPDNLDAAQKEVERWQYEVEKDPSTFNNRQLARAYKNAYQINKALDACLKAVEKDPNDPLTYELLSDIYTMMGDKEELIDTQKKIIALDPNNIQAKIKLGNYLLTQSGGTKEAIEVLEDVVKMSPENEQANLYLGFGYLQEKIYDKAEKQFKWSVEKNPNNYSALGGLGDIYMKEKKYDDAIEQYDKAVKLIETAMASIKDNNDFNTMYQLRSILPSMYIQLADAYGNKGNNKEALANYNKVLEIYPDDVDTRIKLIELYEKSGENDKVIKELQLAGNIAKKNKDSANMTKIALMLYKKQVIEK